MRPTAVVGPICLLAERSIAGRPQAARCDYRVRYADADVLGGGITRTPPLPGGRVRCREGQRRLSGGSRPSPP
jgi:hypothetical protein